MEGGRPMSFTASCSFRSIWLVTHTGIVILFYVQTQLYLLLFFYGARTCVIIPRFGSSQCMMDGCALFQAALSTIGHYTSVLEAVAISVTLGAQRISDDKDGDYCN